MANYDIRPLQLRILKNLLAVDKVCKEHNLRYYIMAGTMLGACLLYTSDAADD